MEVSTLWWLATGAAVAVELATGTFYLLMFALGLAAAALATHAGLGMSTQFVVAGSRSIADTSAKQNYYEYRKTKQYCYRYQNQLD